MNFDFSDEQGAIKDTAREFLASRYPLTEARRMAEDEQAGYDMDRWREIVELGWPGIFVTEEQGGQGLGLVELVILQEELGYALAPTPFFSHACATMLVPELGSAERLGTLAREGGPVPDAGGADVLVLARGGEAVAVEAGEVEVEPAPALDPTRPLFTVRAEGATGQPFPGDLERAGDAIAVALAAESVGVAQRAMEMAVEYAKERKQFDRPIGAYQAVSHRCAQMLLEVEGARSVTYHAAWALDNEPESAPLAASVAKAYASDAGHRVTGSALQVLGGIGFTWEHDLHMLLKRAKANAQAFGDARSHRGRVAELAGV